MKIKTNQKINYTNYKELEALLKEQGYDLMVIPENCFDGDKIKAIQDENNILIEAAEENILCINKGSYCNAVYCSNQTVAIATGRNITISDEVVISNITSFAKDEGTGLFGGIKQLVSFEILINGNSFKKMEIPWNADIEKNAVSAIIKEIMEVKYSHINMDDAVEVFETKQHIKENFSEEIKEVFKIESEEVSYTSDFEEFDIYFKVVSNKNPDVHIEGYVTINDEEAEDVDWYYLDAQGIPQNQMFVEHDGVDGFAGATDEQKWEVEQFRSDYGEDAFWIDNCILQSDADENRTYVRKDVTLIINEGAKMECEIKEIETCWEYQYVVELIPRFNGELIDLAGFMDEKNIIFDPYGVGDDDAKFFIEEGHIYFEISKDWFEGDEEDKEDNLKIFINPEAENIYKQYLTSKLGVYSIASRIYEEEHGKIDESGCDKFASRWEQSFEDFDVAELYLISEEDVERIIKEELEEDDY